MGHVFGSMGGMYYKKVGVKRAKTVIGLMNLTYNMFRKIQLGDIDKGNVRSANAV